MTGDPHRLPQPKLAWREDGSPESEDFGDLYFSAEDGAAETAHVFLNGNALPEAWAGRQHFIIGETGFGTGLNFLSVWDLWRRTRQAGAALHFISVEGFPLSADEMARAHSAWPQFAGLSAQLIAAYPPRVPGFHRLDLSDGVTLTLLFGEAADQLAALETGFDAGIDAWFLDGFAPARNEAMWSADVFSEMARLSKPGTTLATFTVAGAVRRNLEGAGFDVSKAPGFGRKRDMLRGTYKGGVPESRHPPWFRMPDTPRPSSALVIGGGIAGAAAAHALKARGIETRLLESGPAPGSGASGNTSALFMPRLALGNAPTGLFYRAAYLHALRFYEGLEQKTGTSFFRRTGVLQSAKNAEEETRFRAMEERGVLPEEMMRFCGPREATQLAGPDLPHGALYFPQGGTLSPAALLEALLKDVHCLFNTAVYGLRKKSGRWQALDADGAVLAEADCAVLAAGGGLAGLVPEAALPLQPVAGQVTMFSPAPSTRALKIALAFGSYLLPAEDGVQITGASFIKDDSSSVPVQREDEENLAALERAGFDGVSGCPVLASRRSVRCAAADRMPLAGPLPDAAAFEAAYHRLGKGGFKADYPPAPWLPGLYALGGLGSRGFLTAPLLAETLAAMLTGGVLPLPRPLGEAVSPARFLIRQLRRGQA